MELLTKLTKRWAGIDTPFLIDAERSIRLEDVTAQELLDLSEVRAGDTVALIGDFDPVSIATLLRLIDLRAILVPLTQETRHDHPYFFEQAHVDVVIKNGQVIRCPPPRPHPLIEELRRRGHAGLVLFSTGTTGRPKAILHDMTYFLDRFETPRPTLRTLGFLLFDHIGGINTLFHTLFNRGVVVAPVERTALSILETIRAYGVELLPTTPTFLRMMLISGAIPERVPDCLKVITYGTERMDQPTLDELCRLMPDVDFRQTFGMSELGIVRVKSKSRDSLFMKIGGDGVETRIIDNVLELRSPSRMLGYLNAPSPFDAEGWYSTKDIVETDGDFIRVVGRTNDVINVGGLKFFASDVERAALEYPGVALVSVYGRANPITGQHVEMKVQLRPGVTVQKETLSAFMKSRLPSHMVPYRITFGTVDVGHRFKKA